jgi:hypothetical protein
MQTYRLPKIWKLYLHWGRGRGGVFGGVAEAKTAPKYAAVHRFTTTNDLLGFFTKQLTCCVPTTYKLPSQRSSPTPQRSN